MSRMIIKQPNGKYCVFSSVVDNVIYHNVSADDIIEIYTNEYKEEIKEKISETIKQLEDDKNPYHQFTKSYTEMIKTIQDTHGESEAIEIKKAIEK